MVSNDKRYADLPHEVRAFLETLDGEGVTNLSDLLRLYRDLSIERGQEKISVIDFLLNAKPATLEWLRDARREEIDLLVQGVRLVGSGRTVGKFTKWALVTLIGAFILMSQFGEALAKLLALLKGTPR